MESKYGYIKTKYGYNTGLIEYIEGKFKLIKADYLHLENPDYDEYFEEAKDGRTKAQFCTLKSQSETEGEWELRKKSIKYFDYEILEIKGNWVEVIEEQNNMITERLYEYGRDTLLQIGLPLKDILIEN